MNNPSAFIRKEQRSEKIKILNQLPPLSYYNKEDCKELNELIEKTKDNSYSFIKELENIREFNNSENINVSSIIMYRK